MSEKDIRVGITGHHVKPAGEINEAGQILAYYAELGLLWSQD